MKRARGVNGLPTRTVLVFSSATLAAARELGPDSDATAAGTDAQQLSVDEGSPRLTGRRSSRKRASWLPGNGQAVRGGALKQGGAAKKAAVAVAAEAAPVCDTGPSDTGGSLAEPASHALATPRGGSSRPGGGSAAVSLPRGVPRVSVGAPADGLLLPSDDAVPLSPSLSLAAAAAPDGLHYFPDDATSCGALVLPRNGRQGKHVTDEQLLAAASTDGAVNCVPGCEHYVVVRHHKPGRSLPRRLLARKWRAGPPSCIGGSDTFVVLLGTGPHHPRWQLPLPRMQPRRVGLPRPRCGAEARRVRHHGRTRSWRRHQEAVLCRASAHWHPA